MIAREHRFHGLGSLRFAYTKGKTVRSSMIALKFIHNTRRTQYRASVVVAKKVHKSAVVRNRIRRRIYSILAGLEAEINGPYDLIFSVYNSQIAEIEGAQLAETVKSLLRQAGVIET